ncbi:MAG: efflux RND transporter periplasmic adaptor subunit [Opitutae bacterium]
MPNKSIASKLSVVVIFLLLGGWAMVYFLRPVAVVENVVRGRAINAVPGSVTVYAEYQMELKSELPGRVARSDLSLGRPVKKGDFLVSLDSGDLELEIQQTENEFKAHQQRLAVGSSLKLELENARDELANMDRLAKLGNISGAELTKQQRVVKQGEQKVALEDVENLQKSDTYANTLKVKRRHLDKMTFLAPFDGVISILYARPGDLIGPNAPIATLIATSRTIEAKISEENFSGIKVGQKAAVRFLGYGNQLFAATVIKVLPTADSETQRYIVHLKVELPEEKLVPGLTGEVTIVIGEREAPAIVPRRALRGDQILVVSGGQVEARKVQLGYVALNQVEVVGGLKEGEQVIVEELDRFQGGMRVRTKSSK